MKYVVDIPENMVIKSALKGLTLGITMKVPSSNQGFVIPTNIQLEPYTEPDICSHTDNSTGWELYQDYQKAKERYEAWEKQIHVGDEVIDKEGDKGIATYVYNGGKLCDVLWDDGSVTEDVDERDFTKTGRHFNEVEELLEKMREN